MNSKNYRIQLIKYKIKEEFLGHFDRGIFIDNTQIECIIISILLFIIFLHIGGRNESH